MTLHLQSLHRFTLPLSRDLVLADRTRRKRTGLFVTLANKAGVQGIGEIAPLSGFHQETLDQCLACITRHRDLLSALPVADHKSETSQTFLCELFPALGPFKALPSLHFGLSMAAINLWATAHGTTPARMLGKSPLRVMPVNRLVTESCDRWQEAVRKSVAAEQTTIKLKVGRSDLTEEMEALIALQDHYGNAVRYVLDGNRGWTWDEAITFLERVSTDSIHYGEELLSDPHRLADLTEHTRVAMALDESLFDPEQNASLIQSWPGNVVLKPDRIPGSIETCMALAASARDRGASAIISSAYNTTVGLSFLAELAASLRCPHAGLDTGRWFAEPRGDTRFQICRGGINTCSSWINDLEAFTPYLDEVVLS